MLRRLSVYLVCLFFLGCATSNVRKISPPDAAIELFQEFEGARCMPEKMQYSFLKGERLTYNVEWLGMKVAEATIEIEGTVKIEGLDAYKIKLAAETNGVMAKIFPVHNIYLSYLDTRNINSLKSETDRREGRRIKKDETIFDNINQKAYYRDLLANRSRVFDIPEKTYDVLGAFYYFRTLDVDAGDRVNYNVFSNGKVYPIYAKVEKSEYLEIRDVGFVKAFLIEPYIIRDGKVDKRAKATAYFTADKEKVPLYINLKGPIFTKINIVIQKIEKDS